MVVIQKFGSNVICLGYNANKYGKRIEERREKPRVESESERLYTT